MFPKLKMVLAASVALAGLSGAATAADVKFGFLGGVTGPIESLVPPIIDGANLAVKHVNEQGGLLDGKTIELIVADTTCADATKAADAADRVVNVDNVVAIVGALCSGATISAANNAGIPGGVAMISPASTSPALTTLDDKGLVFRTATSDAYQGGVLARVVQAAGKKNVAVTYVNNDYGKGFADAFSAAFTAAGGTVAASEAHEDGKADYRAEIGSLSATGAEALVILAYADGSGQTVLRQALEGGDFDVFYGGDGMVSQTLADNVPAAGGKIIMTRPSTPDLPGADAFAVAASAADVDANGTFVSNSYDAAFILALAAEKAGSTDRAAIAAQVSSVANAPGEVILPTEWKKAKELIAAGKDINYEGAAGPQSFDENGDVPGTYETIAIEDGKIMSTGVAE
ncbi:ABC transporter substrate-binding protein [Hoeflea prorocentri]|uniref:ABC transporter substrate-binding protein n=1 Tax=Hoeflea prorocentri TaxID=1922333 RepID=A0A9X3UJM0_9HYPH|nr:ABC transporter substrate-binding protein [Hoeflea prorocentri]MCY6382058.1 ABC transporter substrate-binding protein [Hoeflea prorocentri]MDA5399858.1 ABC transporter substrate-binding protein [Hoeflea prorocentri]